MKTRESLITRLKKIDLSSLSDEQVDAIQHLLDNPENIKGETKIKKDIISGQNAINLLNNTIEALQRSEEKYHELFENTNDVVFTMDFNGNFTSINPVVEKLVGYKFEELADHNMKKYLTPKSAERAFDNIVKKLKGEKEHTVYEVDFVNKDGSLTFFEVNSMLRYKDDKPYEVLGIARDITERKRNEKILRESEEKYRLIIENIDDVIYSYNTDGTILFVSTNCYNLFGFTSAEIIGKNLIDFVYEEDKEIAITELKKTILNKESHPFVCRLMTKNGTILFIEERGKVILDENGEIIMFTGIIRNITEHHRIEEQIKTALAEKEVLLKEIHHRVKNNMQIIISLMNMQMQDSRDPIMVEKIKGLQQRIRAMSIIHENLYMSGDLSRINFEKYLHKLSTNLMQIYSHKFEIDLKLKVADFKMEIDTAIPCGLIVNELLSNSLKYAFPENWMVNNKKEYQIYVEFTSEADKFLLVVGDNGIGIPENIEEIKTKTLGLLLVEILANQLKGSLSVSNHDGVRYEIAIEKEEKKN